ncbi:MAG: Flp pilus assembly protein CpaB [Vicinamibacterales bacterium]
MARMRVLIVLALALTAGSVLAYATYNIVQRTPEPGAGLPTKSVVVAATDLAIGAELKPSDLKVVPWPATSLPAGAVTDPQAIVGRGIVMPLIENEPILPMKLASKEAGAGLPPVIPPGLRAMSVRVNEVIGVAGYVLPGTHVDVIATVNPSEKTSEITSKVILTDVQVLAAGTKLEQDGEGNKPMAVSVVTLLVNPEEAERLTLASGEGKIQLALRNPLDKETPATRGVRAAALVGTPAPAARQMAARRQVVAPAPAPLPPPAAEPATVEFIRGDKRAREIVQSEQ